MNNPAIEYIPYQILVHLHDLSKYLDELPNQSEIVPGTHFLKPNQHSQEIYPAHRNIKFTGGLDISKAALVMVI